MCIEISGRIYQKLVTIVRSGKGKCIARDQRAKKVYSSLYSLLNLSNTKLCACVTFFIKKKQGKKESLEHT